MVIVGQRLVLVPGRMVFQFYPREPAWTLAKSRETGSLSTMNAMLFGQAIGHGWIDMFLARMAVDRLAKQ